MSMCGRVLGTASVLVGQLQAQHKRSVGGRCLANQVFGEEGRSRLQEQPKETIVALGDSHSLGVGNGYGGLENRNYSYTACRTRERVPSWGLWSTETWRS